ncbi:MAG: bifunctional acetate--CoA ligase family protein/GNAT family N-acetyltransferase [Thermodesulfobacteriota bacterium]|nr:bifunctional acetate--CoA ligase family protein/GNAT family N-acetyltransferase [Thermodesulfobacteriota bacterium]
MSVHNLDKLFSPASVAVIGASEKEDSIGAAIMQNLCDFGYSGTIYPVNPHYKNILGRKAYAEIQKLPAAPDLAVIATPIATVPEIVKDLAGIGCAGGVVISAGGKETGQEGVRREAAIKQAAQERGFRIIGPNCLGIISDKSRLNATFASCMPQSGGMAFVSQSGAICTAILDFSKKENIGFSYFISLGSMLDVDFGDILDYLGSDPKVDSIVLYVENFTRFRNFMSAARAVSRIKPVIALKAGRTKAGALAAASHTGALASEDAVYDAAFKRAGIVRVKTFQELFDCAAFLARQPKVAGDGLAIVTNAGGPGVMAADSMADYGGEPVRLSPETISRLNGFLPPHWSHGNPVDILGDASPERYRKTVEVLMQAREVNGLLIMLAPQTMTRPAEVAEVLVEILKDKKTPVFTAWMGGAEVEAGRRILNRGGIGHFDTPERAVRAFMDLYQYSRNNALLQEIPPSLPGKLSFDRPGASEIIQTSLGRSQGFLTEIESKKLLDAYGIPVNPTRLATTADEAVTHAATTGYPVVLKVHSLDISHKTDAGGVVTGINDEPMVRDAFERIMANARAYAPKAVIDGVTVQKMIPAADHELIIGARMDRDFGPVLLFGMGGIYTEVYQDSAIALPPLNRLLARQMMSETRIYQALKGFRNRPAADMVRLEEIMIRLSQLVTDFSEIQEIDINPLLVTAYAIVAADARVSVKPAEKKTPHHLVISPYPNQLEETVFLEDAGQLMVRPIRPEDAPMVVDLFNSLSPQSIYNRFFSPMKTLPHDMLARFTQIDYDRQVALVAVLREGEQDRLIGIARVIPEYNMKNAEFAVLVDDQWHGKGVGATLLERCLDLARQLEIEKVYGTVLADNTKMLALGKKLGFTIKRVPGADTYELSLCFPPRQPESPS